MVCTIAPQNTSRNSYFSQSLKRKEFRQLCEQAGGTEFSVVWRSCRVKPFLFYPVICFSSMLLGVVIVKNLSQYGTTWEQNWKAQGHRSVLARWMPLRTRVSKPWRTSICSLRAFTHLDIFFLSYCTTYF